MPFGLFRSQQTPILADFGSSGVKLLQVSPGATPTVTAAAFIAFDDELRAQTLEQRFACIAAQLPAVLKTSGFRGNRVVVAPFSQHMLVQHVAVALADADRADSVVGTQIAIGLECDPQNLVVRTSRVCETTRDGQPKVELLAFAMSRDDVMRYVQLFAGAKLKVVGVHGEISALVHAFDHVNRRVEDTSVTTMYIDLGYSGTKVAISHGPQTVFAKSIAIAGRTFDARIAESRSISLANARALRLAEGVRPVRARQPQAPTAVVAPTEAMGGIPSAPQASATSPQAASAEVLPAIFRAGFAQEQALINERRAGAPAPALGSPLPEATQRSVAVDCRETLESLCDELGMCTRYYGGLFRERRIDRVVFLGGEARDIGLCQALAASLRIPAKAGDPMARFLSNGPAPEGLPEPEAAHPGWAVACGLAAAPTDL
ncbi:MAG: pilus assembly protein PilM [Planctomycetota bacterium]|jgi:Tfp pilus assembly PilM family ATPase